jgi:hypothetical protein
MNLGLLSRRLLLCVFGTTAVYALETRPPYAETSSFSILSNFYIVGITQTTRPLPVNVTRFLPDGADVKPGERLTTAVGKPIIFETANGDQAFFVRLLQQRVLGDLASDYQDSANRLSLINLLITERRSLDLKKYTDFVDKTRADASFAAANAQATIRNTRSNRFLTLYLARTELAEAQRYLELADYGVSLLDFNAQELENERVLTSQLATRLYGDISELSDRLDGLWELTAVRAPQTSVAASASTSYTITLSSVDFLLGRPTSSYDTGLRIELIGTAPSTRETLVDGALSSASGNLRAHFRLAYELLDTGTPLHSLGIDGIPNAVFRKDYATSGLFWRGEITGLLSYDVRATTSPARFKAITQTSKAPTFTGTGFWFYQTYDADGVSRTFNAGVSPTRALIGTIKYQDETLFSNIDLR